MSKDVLQIERSTTPPATAARTFPFVAGGLFVWMFLWIYVSWPYSLDDALIHLRYADHLLHQHHITYDGVHDSFGTSSLLYVSILAVLRAVWTSPLLPRVVSSAAYVIVVAGVAVSLFRALRQADARGFLWLMSMALLAVLVEPSAARWLNDGMETGLVFVDVVAGFLLLRRALQARSPSVLLFFAGFAYGLLTALLRIELLMLVGCISAMAALETLRRDDADSAVDRQLSARTAAALMPMVGGLTAVGIVWFTMHALLPDTAIAKAFGSAAWDQTVRMSAITIASSFSFGIGLLLLWLASLGAVVEFCRFRLADLCANALFPAVLLLSAFRGQQIQGIRYFGWTLLFPLLWNLVRCAEDAGNRSRHLERSLTAFAALLLCGLVFAAAWESRVFYRLFQGRGSALNTFRSQDLTGLRDKLGIAEDVGFVGYFTQGDICDPYGLVNGRALARLTYQPRFDRCMSLHPRFAFGSETFLHRVEEQQNLADWLVCGRYRFDNVRTSDMHYLVVAPGDAPAACAKNAQMLRSTLPGIY